MRAGPAYGPGYLGLDRIANTGKLDVIRSGIITLPGGKPEAASRHETHEAALWSGGV